MKFFVKSGENEKEAHNNLLQQRSHTIFKNFYVLVGVEFH